MRFNPSADIEQFFSNAKQALRAIIEHECKNGSYTRRDTQHIDGSMSTNNWGKLRKHRTPYPCYIYTHIYELSSTSEVCNDDNDS